MASTTGRCFINSQLKCQQNTADIFRDASAAINSTGERRTAPTEIGSRLAKRQLIIE